MHRRVIRIHIVSYSFPPDNVPAAHRPYQLAKYCADQGIPYTVHSRSGRITEISPSAAIEGLGNVQRLQGSSRSRRLLGTLNRAIARFARLDKGAPWALRMLPKLLWDVRADVHAGLRPVIWATAPLMSNLQLAWVVSVLTGAELHVDLRDAVDGINSRRMPWLTWKILARARTVTTVTPSVARMIDRRTSISANLVYNGISEDALNARVTGRAAATGWVEVSYAGALYGGDRPYRRAIELLRQASKLLPSDVEGIRLRIATREALEELLAEPSDSRFRIEHCGELSKRDALALAARSHVNLLLLGSGEMHRCGIPLKTYDLLGVGRPIFYFGPADADALGFLQTYGQGLYHAIDSESDISLLDDAASHWLFGSTRAASAVLSEPSARSQSRLILDAIERGA